MQELYALALIADITNVDIQPPFELVAQKQRIDIGERVAGLIQNPRLQLIVVTKLALQVDRGTASEHED